MRTCSLKPLMRTCSNFAPFCHTSRTTRVYDRSDERSGHQRPKPSVGRGTHAGHPMTTAAENNTVFPFPYPRDLYMAGANRGKPNPASDLSVPTAARADAE